MALDFTAPSSECCFGEKMSKVELETRVDMKTLDFEKTCDILNRIMQFELAGVVRYSHYATR